MKIVPELRSRRVEIRAATVADRASFVHTVVRSGIESVRPVLDPGAGPDRADVLFTAVHRASRDTLGFSVLFSHDQAAHIRCGIYLDPQRAKLGVGSEVVGLTINYAFAAFDVHRVITETTPASGGSFGLAVGGGTKSENSLTDRLWFRGRFWDLHGFQVTRREWEAELAAIESGESR
ncbi:GNAT family N-acetyltransferase [Rhodococcus qingshengii]|uniref:GNAT family N-acetyltransferase n=1 Tax=Rhodococcus qingshengii TaxID=334542 RepID=UPI0036DE60EF